VTIPVSVVVPTHDSAATIVRALRSAATQSARPCEIVVVDDASSDATLALVAELAAELPVPVRTIPLAENVGPGSARNAGWDAATGEWVAFLDADDAWHPEKLSVQHALMAAEPALAMSGHLHAFRSGDDWARVSARPAVVRFDLRDFLVRNRCSTPSVMVRRGIAQRFERGSSFAEDYLLGCGSSPRTARARASRHRWCTAPTGRSAGAASAGARPRWSAPSCATSARSAGTVRSVPSPPQPPAHGRSRSSPSASHGPASGESASAQR